MTSIPPRTPLNDPIPRTVRAEEDYMDPPSQDDIFEKQGLLSMENSSKSGLQSTYSIRKMARNTFFLVLVLIFGYLLYLKSTLDQPPVIETISEIEKTTFDLVKDDEPTLTSIPLVSSTPQIPFQEVFQVYQPVLTPEGVVDSTINSTGSAETGAIDITKEATSCSQVLMVHDFAFSFGLPFVGNYTPPSCSFNRVTLNFTVVSSGRQFDRLAEMYFGDTEVWRTSTAEPSATGIEWTYIKDMSHFLYFWNSPQTLIFDLQNLINDEDTGIYNTTLTATFFTSQDTVDPADLIIPISARNGDIDMGSIFMVPTVNASNTIAFPQNANRAVFSVYACGQASEEFWWSAVLQSDIDTFVENDGILPGFSPWREVQVLIDGTLAGVQWPWPIIFTGGVSPTLWRPAVGIDAFDLQEHEIDITPWLGVLSDGNNHTFEIRVAGLNDNGGTEANLTEGVNDSWYVTGKIFLWLDDEDSITTGDAPTILLPSPVVSVSQSLGQANGTNETLAYSIAVQRSLSVSSTITTQNGSSLESWTQTLSFSNEGSLAEQGNLEINTQLTTGVDESTGRNFYKTEYTYPLFANSTFIELPGGNFTIQAVVNRSKFVTIDGASVFPTGLQPFSAIPRTASLVDGFSGTKLSTTQNGTTFLFESATTASSFGESSQDFSFSGTSSSGGDTELYHRFVRSVNETLVEDVESLAGVEVGSYVRTGDVNGGRVNGGFKLTSPKAALGRGFGTVKPVQTK